MPPVASRQWSTGTLLDGIECLNQHNPAELLAAGDMSEAPPASREQAIQASLLSFELSVQIIGQDIQAKLAKIQAIKRSKGKGVGRHVQSNENPVVPSSALLTEKPVP